MITASLMAWANRRPSPRGDGDHAGPVRRWLVWSGVIAVAVLLVSMAAGNHQRFSPTFDILDEGAHYDYVLDLTHGHVPVSGDRLSQPTMRTLSCLGEVGFPPRGCSVQNRNPTSFPAGGYSYESVAQPPLGYLPYLLTAQPNDSPRAALAAVRWGGFIWGVVAAGLLVWVGWLADLSLLELCGVLSICLLSPVEVHAAATVTNDSAGVVAGAAVLGYVPRGTPARNGNGRNRTRRRCARRVHEGPFRRRTVRHSRCRGHRGPRQSPQTAASRFLAKVRLSSLHVPRRGRQFPRLVVDSRCTRQRPAQRRASRAARLPDNPGSAPVHRSRRSGERAV